MEKVLKIGTRRSLLTLKRVDDEVICELQIQGTLAGVVREGDPALIDHLSVLNKKGAFHDCKS